MIKQTPTQIFLRFLKFGLLAWGGPVAQIAMIRKELVEEEEWVTKEQFNRALAVYQVLPGPEAHELCVYFGMKAGGRWGGFLAGLAFMLPGFLLMLLCTALYIHFGLQSPTFKILFEGIQAVVVALILFAVYRIGKHTVTNASLLVIALCSAMASFTGVHFVIVLLVAGLAYAAWQKEQYLVTGLIAIIWLTSMGFQVKENGFPWSQKKQQQHIVSTSYNQAYGKVFLTGLKGGLLTFGGAYTAIPFIQRDAVVQNKWMSNEEFLDGIALSGILPAPLIIFSTFVGYFGGGWPGAVLITIAIFLPAFSFTLAGHGAMEKLIANTALHNLLDGITAGVIGLIGVTAIQLLLTTVTSWMALAIVAASIIIQIKFRSKFTAIFLIPGAGAFSLIWHYFV
ncbi:chromate efflux transporter [Flavihumibacter profundi]|uniref:chromate efflux transporter n=1 Tax=Flavihumibacter profundi TaxID=2716883 RepID=UPI001CC54998|nr:chromate efflux transporter [Flavihumibacter profundi]MBZ5855581.1 chromate efflux transporter [Flavihumibacter profundi]